VIYLTAYIENLRIDFGTTTQRARDTRGWDDEKEVVNLVTYLSWESQEHTARHNCGPGSAKESHCNIYRDQMFSVKVEGATTRKVVVAAIII
jgi:hypothetical protein